MTLLLRFEGLLLSVAVLLTTATQLRPQGLPLGIGEIMVASWIAWRVIVLASNPVRKSEIDLSVLLAYFWVALFCILTAGFMLSYNSGSWDVASGSHDFIALSFGALLSILLAHFLRSHDRIEKFVRYLLWGSAIALVVLLFLAVTRGTFLGVDPWYMLLRFTGWSKNPNQLALLIVSLPFLALWLIRNTQYSCGKCIGVALFVYLVAAVLCQSDALFVAWAVGGGVVAVFAWVGSLHRNNVSSRSAFISAIGIPGVVIALGIWFSTTALSDFVSALINVYEQGAQGSLRLSIWSHGIDAFSDSPLVGHGPGAFSGVLGPYRGYEAHNTFIDLATNTGLLGLVLYIALIGGLLIRLFKERQIYLFAALASITVFSCFHYVLRHPIYWVVLVICCRVVWSTTTVAATDLVRVAGNKPDEI